MKTFYMVLRVSNSGETQALDSLPTKRHEKYADALNEALRLSSITPGARAFVVLKSVAGYETKLVPTHSEVEFTD